MCHLYREAEIELADVAAWLIVWAHNPVKLDGQLRTGGGCYFSRDNAEMVAVVDLGKSSPCFVLFCLLALVVTPSASWICSFRFCDSTVMFNQFTRPRCVPLCFWS